MAREGLMDDCGYDFEPSEAEERAFDDGYSEGIEDTLKRARKKLEELKAKAVGEYGADIAEAKADALDGLEEWLQEEERKWKTEKNRFTNRDYLRGYDDGYDDGYEAGKDDEHDKKIRADAIDEAIEKLAESEDTILSDRQYYTLLELKEQKNDIKQNNQAHAEGA